MVSEIQYGVHNSIWLPIVSISIVALEHCFINLAVYRKEKKKTDIVICGRHQGSHAHVHMWYISGKVVRLKEVITVSHNKGGLGAERNRSVGENLRVTSVSVCDGEIAQ